MLCTRILTTLMAALAGLWANAQKNDGMHRYSTDFTLSPTNFTDTIPIIIEDGQIYLTVSIDGRRYVFNLDTGSSQGVVYVDGPIRYSNPVGNVESRDANGKTDTIPVVRLPEMRIGNLSIGNYTCVLLKRPKGQYRYDGIIGFDLFNKGIHAKIDTHEKVLVVSNDKHCFSADGGYVMRYRLRRFVPYVSLYPFNKQKEEMLFDTGSPEFLVINDGSLERMRKRDDRVSGFIEEETHGQSAIAHHGTEEHRTISYLTIPRLPWGEIVFRDIHTHTTQGSSKIGAPLLSYGSVIINPKRKTLTFIPFEDRAEITIDNKLQDISYVPHNGRAMVGMVRNNSTPYRNGFRQGDIILSINSDEIYSFDAFRQYSFVRGERYVFLLRTHEGMFKKVVVDSWGE